MRSKSQRVNMDEPAGGMVQLGPEGSQPLFCCTKLPRHWRSNKSLAAQFRVISYEQIPDNTRCSLLAGNDENHSAQLKNNVALFRNNVAEFCDLRFVGKSGRGKLFNVTITVWTDPIQVLVYRHAIKVTADGPRPPRPKYPYSNVADNTNTSGSDSSTEIDGIDRVSFGGVQKKQQKPKQKHACPIEINHMLEGSNITDSQRPSSCASNTSTLSATTQQMLPLSSIATGPPSSRFDLLVAAVLANIVTQTLGQNETQIPTTASFGHKPWLKPPIWRPYSEDSQ